MYGFRKTLLSGNPAARRCLLAIVTSSSAAAAGWFYWHAGDDNMSISDRQSGKDTIRTSVQCEEAHRSHDKLIFLGTGSSTGCPRPVCPLLFSSTGHGDSDDDEALSPDVQQLKSDMISSCRTSNLAVQSGGDPSKNKNYRNNPSFLISKISGDGYRKNVIIDVGKTFREGALRWLPRHNIRTIDSIVLTHEHMDAAGGLDDVRGFQKYFKSPIPGERNIQMSMPLFLSSECLEQLQNQFPWLLPKPVKDENKVPEDGKPVVSRHVASFDVTLVQPFQPFEALPGFEITPLPVMHGEDLVSFGFAFTVGQGYNVVYLSDISRMLPETLEYILNKLPQPTHLLVLDALLMDKPNPVHYNLRQAMDLAQQIRPEQTYLVGMNCDKFLPHDEMNEQLRSEYGENVRLAHDGLVITIK